MKLNTPDKPHAGTVSAALTFVGYEMRPDEFTALLGVQPSFVSVSQLPAKFNSGGICRGRDCGLWSYDTAGLLPSRDIGEHIRHLIRSFRPLKNRIEEVSPRPNAFVHLRCEPIFATQGLSPCIDADCVAGLAELGATLTVELIKNGEVDGG